MAVALQDHARLAIAIDGQWQLTPTSIDMTTNSGQQRVDTLEGLAGFTPGSGDVTVTVNFALPIGGQEFDVQGTCALGAFVTMQVPLGPADYIGNGKIIDNNFSQSVNANTEGSFTWTGELAAAE